MLEKVQKELLRSVSLNTMLEYAAFEFQQPTHDNMRQQFLAELDRFCLRNRVSKLSQRVKEHGCPPGLAPHVMKLLLEGAMVAEQKKRLCNTLVFSVLRSGRLDPASWESIQDYVLNNSGTVV